MKAFIDFPLFSTKHNHPMLFSLKKKHRKIFAEKKLYFSRHERLTQMRVS